MVRLELINLIIGSTNQILKNSIGITIKKEQLSADDLPHTLHDINVVFGISGEISTTIVLGMSPLTAKRMASLILGKVVSEAVFASNTVTIVGSDICRLITENMIKSGKDVYPRHPSLVTGKKITLSTLQCKKLVVNLETDIGNMELRITV